MEKFDAPRGLDHLEAESGHPRTFWQEAGSGGRGEAPERWAGSGPRRRQALLGGLFLLAALGAAGLFGCGSKHKARVGPLSEWIVGQWVRSDDKTVWSFSNGELLSSGRLPISGAYAVEEPDQVVVRVTGANAVTSSAQLGLPLDAGRNLVIHLKVTDDEMHVSGMKSSVVFKKN